jgi:RNA polymerase sigma-70 factor (ECF subfamily)
MGDLTRTHPSLLLRVRDPKDKDAWTQFVELYGPMIYRFARKHRLQDADAADLTQSVLQAVAGSVRRLRYDPARGSFRGWLFQVVRRQMGKFAARQRRQPRGSGDPRTVRMLDELPGREGDDAVEWDREYERQLFLWAAERVRGRFEPSSWGVFWLTVVDGGSASEAARKFGLSLGAVYTAKSRVLDRLRREIELVHGDGSAAEKT